MTMTMYSPVAPVHLLRQLHKEGALDRYLLLLAHDVLEHPYEYQDIIADLFIDEDHDVFVIMDNGTVENGHPVTKEELVEAAQLVEASCVVSPDVIGDMEATKKLVIEQVPYLRQHFPVMFVPQGQNHMQLNEFMRWAIDKYIPRYWGIPRWIANKLGTRAQFVSRLNYQYNEYASPAPRIHLLGMSNHIEDDIACLHMRNVMGIDSANPLVVGQAGKPMSMFEYEHIDRGDYWQQTHLSATALANVRWMHAAAAKAR